MLPEIAVSDLYRSTRSPLKGLRPLLAGKLAPFNSYITALTLIRFLHKEVAPPCRIVPNLNSVMKLVAHLR